MLDKFIERVGEWRNVAPTWPFLSTWRWQHVWCLRWMEIVLNSLGVLHPENMYPLSMHASLSKSTPCCWRSTLERESRGGHGASQSESGVVLAWLGLGLETPAYPSPWRLLIYCIMWNSCMYIWLLLFEYWTLLGALLYLFKKLIYFTPLEVKFGHYVKWQKFSGSLSHDIFGGMGVTA